MAHVGIVSAAYWGDVMPFVPVAEVLGVGTSLPFRRRSPSRLADALHEVLNETCAAAASRLAGRLHGENGPVAAADHLEAILTDAEETSHAQ